jgi:hypothetical protein
MAETPPTTPPETTDARARLLELAGLLRGARHLSDDDRRELADLVAELATTIDPAAPSPQAAHLAEAAAHLVQALHERHDAGPIAAARRRLEDAAARAEARAPVATGLARRLIDTLADIGI